MKFVCLLAGLFLGIWGFSPVFAQNTVNIAAPASPPPVVLELFSSQGCAFCPPADALMGQMVQQDGIIGLSCHVDYFGIKQNSLGKHFCTLRQNEYNRLIGTGPRYTPQLVVNGHYDVIGYETNKVNAAILKARGDKIAPIDIVPTGVNGYSFSLPQKEFGPPDAVQLWLAVFDLPHSIAITEGSNFGKKITYFNVVDKIQALGAWDGTAGTKTITVPFEKQNAGFAVIAQNTRTGHIIAAGKFAK